MDGMWKRVGFLVWSWHWKKTQIVHKEDYKKEMTQNGLIKSRNVTGCHTKNWLTLLLFATSSPFRHTLHYLWMRFNVTLSDVFVFFFLALLAWIHQPKGMANWIDFKFIFKRALGVLLFTCDRTSDLKQHRTEFMPCHLQPPEGANDSHQLPTQDNLGVDYSTSVFYGESPVRHNAHTLWPTLRFFII